MKYFITVLCLFLFAQLVDSQELNVEKIWKNYEFRSKGIDGFRSMNDGEHFTQVIDNSLFKFKINDPEDQGKLLVGKDKLLIEGKELAFDDYFFNEDETKILFTTQTEPIYRRSFSAVYYLFDLQTNSLTTLDADHQPQTWQSILPMVKWFHSFIKMIYLLKIFGPVKSVN